MKHTQNLFVLEGRYWIHTECYYKKRQINVVVATFKSATQNKRVVTYVHDNAYNEEPQASDVIALVKFDIPNNMHMKRECEDECRNVTKHEHMKKWE